MVGYAVKIWNLNVSPTLLITPHDHLVSDQNKGWGEGWVQSVPISVSYRYVSVIQSGTSARSLCIFTHYSSIILYLSILLLKGKCSAISSVFHQGVICSYPQNE
jgi:hypothetical protein